LDFVRKKLKDAALVGGGGGPVFLKLNDWLEVKGSSGDLWLEDPYEVSSSGLSEVNDNWLWSDGGVDLLTNAFGKEGAGEMLF
jgi:hypothetical protein